MPERSTIPLFPLSVVVFPGQALPLHIFEPRYQAMIAECRAAAERGEVLPVGICFGQDTTVHREVGCTVVLEKVLNEYEDGRLDILTVGHQRYRLLAIYEDKPYLMARVEFFGDEAEEVDPRLVERVRTGYERLNRLVEAETGARLEVPIPEGSFQIALAAGLALAVRQEMLEMRSENLRLQTLIEHFGQLLPALEKRQEEKRKVKSNGRFKGKG
jgi:ATP-dependent Lon protease